MRTDIYYWKCDCPLPTEGKLVHNDKYALADISEMVRSVAVDYFGREPVAVRAAKGEGNHYAYLIQAEDRTVFFRADDGKLDDDYMDAECAVMALVKSHGVPVPEVYRVDTSMTKYPFRYQLMELVAGRCLNEFHRAGELDKVGVGRQLGRLIAKIHQIELDGFGFINTDRLRTEERLVGLDATHGAYFYKKLGDHLRFVQDQEFLTSEEIREIEDLFQKHDGLLTIERGCLVHKDLAFWNVIGEPSRIRAIIDWDDAIIGDPVDDLAILKCFYHDDVFLPVLEGYQEVRPLPNAFYPKLWLYLIRNMLWKTVIRITMKYFEMKEKCFIANRDIPGSLRKFTYDRLLLGMRELRAC